MSSNCYRYGRRRWPVALEGASVAILVKRFNTEARHNPNESPGPLGRNQTSFALEKKTHESKFEFWFSVFRRDGAMLEFEKECGRG